MQYFKNKFTEGHDVLEKQDFVIIANNCWGAEIYKKLKLPYNTPFVGLFIYSPDYIKLLDNLDYYLNSILMFGRKSKWTNSQASYPIGFLEEIEIHFIHYKSNEEAFSKWNRRTERMLRITEKDNYYFKICDLDYADLKTMIAFHNLPFKNKISFGINTIKNTNHIKITENEQKKHVRNGVQLYKDSTKYFDPIKWVTTNEPFNACLNKKRWRNVLIKV